MVVHVVATWLNKLIQEKKGKCMLLQYPKIKIEMKLLHNVADQIVYISSNPNKEKLHIIISKNQPTIGCFGAKKATYGAHHPSHVSS